MAPRAILIVSAVRFLREGIADAIEGSSQFSVAGLYDDLDQALTAIRDHGAVTILLDAAFPDGLQALREIRAVNRSICLVVFAVSETEENVVAWAKAGATGYIPTTAALNELVGFVDSIMRGEQICSAAIASRLLRRIGTALAPDDTLLKPNIASSLTAREREIVRMISEGFCNKDIARQLQIELSTTKSHVHNLLGKLRLQRRSQVAQWLLRRESDRSRAG